MTIVPLPEADAVVDWRAIAASMMEENEALKRTLRALPHEWQCLHPDDRPSADGSECDCWRSEMPSWMLLA